MKTKKTLSQEFMSFCKDYCKEFISIDRRNDILKGIEVFEKQVNK